MKRHHSLQKGVTLLELIMAIVIIGVITAFAGRLLIRGVENHNT